MATMESVNLEFCFPDRVTILCLSLGMLLGFAVHRLLLIRGEWHIQAPAIIVAHLSAFFGLLLMRSFTQTTAHDLLSRLLSVHNGYLTGLTFSVVVYRVFLHPLTQAGFPGPWYAPISKIWNVWAARHRKNHLVLHALNQKYGDFVRTGMTFFLFPLLYSIR